MDQIAKVLYKDNKNVKVMTYNIWFSEKKRTERLISLIENIVVNDPDVICMQEVIKTVYDSLKSNLSLYKYTYPETISGTYGCVIMSKYPIIHMDNINYKNSIMGRGLIYVMLDINGEMVIVANSHFESQFEKINPVKIEQYTDSRIILENLYGLCNNIIFCSDTNIVKGEYEHFITETPKWKDSWDINSGDNGYTYDSEINDNLKCRRVGFFRSRIDRIIYMENASIRPNYVKLIKGVDYLIEPSDHFGVMAEFSL